MREVQELPYILHDESGERQVREFPYILGEESGDSWYNFNSSICNVAVEPEVDLTMVSFEADHVKWNFLKKKKKAVWCF